MEAFVGYKQQTTASLTPPLLFCNFIHFKGYPYHKSRKQIIRSPLLSFHSLTHLIFVVKYFVRAVIWWDYLYVNVFTFLYDNHACWMRMFVNVYEYVMMRYSYSKNIYICLFNKLLWFFSSKWWDEYESTFDYLQKEEKNHYFWY